MALARDCARTGKLVEARDLLASLVYGPPSASEPPSAAAARVEGRRLFDDLGSRIPRVHLKVIAPHGTDVRLSLDGSPLPAGAERAPLPVDPGHHVLSAEAPGVSAHDLAFDVAEHDEPSFALRLEGEPPPVPPSPPDVRPASVEAPPPPPPPVREGAVDEWAPARVGFQLDTRVSVEAPSGSLADGTPLSSFLGVRAYWAFDVGWKLNEWMFLGGYLGASFGSEGGSLTQACQAASQSEDDSDDDSSSSACATLSVDAGAIAMASLNPSGFVNPWVGLGLGTEHQAYAFVGVKGSFDGLELPLLLGGVDFRSRDASHRSTFGIGPYLGATVQKYSSGSVATFAGSSTAPPGTHTWIHVGVRMTLFP